MAGSRSSNGFLVRMAMPMSFPMNSNAAKCSDDVAVGEGTTQSYSKGNSNMSGAAAVAPQAPHLILTVACNGIWHRLKQRQSTAIHQLIAQAADGFAVKSAIVIAVFARELRVPGRKGRKTRRKKWMRCVPFRPTQKMEPPLTRRVLYYAAAESSRTATAGTIGQTRCAASCYRASSSVVRAMRGRSLAGHGMLTYLLQFCGLFSVNDHQRSFVCLHPLCIMEM